MIAKSGTKFLGSTQKHFENTREDISKPFLRETKADFVRGGSNSILPGHPLEISGNFAINKSFLSLV